MYDLSIEYQIDEFMIYCRSRELRAKTLESYEHTLRLFERWCNDELNITQVDQVTESVIRRYITNLQERGKYTFYANEKSKEQNFPERRRDFRKPVSAATINNYIRNLKVFFNWLDSDYVLKKNPMKKVRQADLARRMGLSPQNLNNKMKRDNFTEKDLIDVANALDCTLNINFELNDTKETV